MLGLGVAPEAGGTTPMSPVENVVAVLAAMEKPFVPPINVMLTPGVGTKIGNEVSLVGDGGRTPKSPVEKVVAVLEEVEKEALPIVTVSIVSLRAGVAEPVFAGGIIPESPVELRTNVLLLVAKDAPPEVALVTTTRVMLPVGAGGRTPESPELLIVMVEPEIASMV